MTTITTEAPAVDLPGAPLDAPASPWLPLTAGEAARGQEIAPPEHGWPASWFIFLSNLAAFGLGLGAAGLSVATVVAVVAGSWGSAGMALLAALGCALGCVVQRSLATHVTNFTRWGWYGAMAELALATLTKVSAIVENPSTVGGAGVGIIIDLLWMHYFWERRADFDIDLSL